MSNYSKEYYLKNRDKNIQHQRNYRAKYPEKVKLNLAKSRKNNPERTLWNRCKERCKKSGLEFTIGIEDIKIPEMCPLLEVQLDTWGNKDFCPSLDRIDNSKGYTPDNIWVISFKANRMKNTATKIELIKFAESILNKFHKDIVS